MSKSLQQTLQVAKKVRRQDFAELGTELYIAPGDTAARWVSEHGRPLGFWTKGQLQIFTEKLYSAVSPRAKGLRVALCGSSVRGNSKDPETGAATERYFDMSPTKASDLDLALSSRDLLLQAQKNGVFIVRTRVGNRIMLRTEELNEDQLEELGLYEVWKDLTRVMEGRRVTFMLYDSIEHLEARGSFMMLNRKTGQ